jgi:nucleoid DNA-binding protein
VTFIELVEEVSRRTVMSKEKVKDVIKEMAAVIEDQVLDNKCEVAIPHFGRFKRRVVKGGERKIGSQMCHVAGRDTLKFVSYAKKQHQ